MGVSASEFLWFVTQFGGAQIVVPASVGIALGLWRLDERETARAFIAAAAFCFCCIVAAKVLLLTAGGFSPSGHTAISTFFYASLAFLAVSAQPSLLAAFMALGLATLIALIGVSRFAVAGHTQLEVAAGLLCGLLSFELFRRNSRLLRTDGFSIARAAPAALVAAFLVNRIMSFGFLEEDDIRGFSEWLRSEIFRRA